MHIFLLKCFRASGEAILGTQRYFSKRFLVIFSQTSLDEGFQKNLATSEPNEEKGQNLRPEIQETDDLRRKRNKMRIVPKHVIFAG